MEMTNAVNPMNESVRASKLILIEGIPGSGKSTAAQHIALQLGRLGIPCIWWYEEQQGHPVYAYDDYASMQTIVDELDQGRYGRVIDKALRQWRAFATAVEAASEVVVADSCLLGYLTWSLFPYNVAPAVTQRYIREIEHIIRPLNPRLIYFYQTDIGAALRQITMRRGGETEANWIRRATESAYGKARGLQGFEGMTSYWEAYRELTDEAFETWPGSKIAIDNTAGDWYRYDEDMQAFLGIRSQASGLAETAGTETITVAALDAEPNTEPVTSQDAQQVKEASAAPGDGLPLGGGIVGSYRSHTEGIPDCSIGQASGQLVVDGLPHAWRQSRLIQVAPNVFHVQSMPLQLQFDERSFHLTGPDLLDGPVDYWFTRIH